MGQHIFDDFAAVQYLTWAIEEIDQLGNPLASQHARSALAELTRAQREAEAMLVVIQENQWPQRP